MTQKQEKFVLPQELGHDAVAIRRTMEYRLSYSAGKDTHTVTLRDWFNVTSLAIRDHLIGRWMETMRHYYAEDTKRVYYLSLEFLIGRTLGNSLINTGMMDVLKEVVDQLELDFEEICESEADAALGNGGLGRLAACFLDSMASIGIPGYGYGIRYEYGMFNQKIENNCQVEHPDSWLRYGNPWEFPRAEVLFPVKFHGRVTEYPGKGGQVCFRWVDTDDVMAMAYDTPVPGYNTQTVNNMRLWSAKSSRDFDLKHFNEGEYIRAVENKNDSENISKVLYPDDTTDQGKTLRLKQQYFFVSASLQDILYRYNKHHNDLTKLYEKVAIQLNDTHPTIAIPELMRLLVDEYDMEWSVAWGVTTKTFAYTNHTLMPEALETWPMKLFENLLPRHMQIIYEINHRFLREISSLCPGDIDMMRRLSIIDEHGERRIRMANLAIIGSHKVNGVAALHTELMKQTIFSDFNKVYPEKIINVTNGITPRRWLRLANPKLATLISDKIGDQWVTDLGKLESLVDYVDDETFQADFAEVKQQNKQFLASKIARRLDRDISPTSLFDVQIKRLHEYKRQLLNVLHIITLYNRLRKNQTEGITPRTFIFSGKAAPGYWLAKLIIHLIHDVAAVINKDPVVSSYIKVVFIPNYDVTTAQDIIPAVDLSEQISTAGTEASGTGNMKMALNGALTIGTLDGANIEILEEVGKDNIFIFGNTADEVSELTGKGYNPWDYYNANNELREVLDMIGSGYFSADKLDRYQPIISTLLHEGDRYLLLADYASYIACQDEVSRLYQDKQSWVKKAILNVARMGKFSSDRTIGEYAKNIWGVDPVRRD